MSLSDFAPYAPFITVFGPIIGAFIGAVVTYLIVVKRKVVCLWLIKSEDVTRPLREQRSDITFRVAAKEILNLNRGGVVAENRGNAAIENFSFEVVIAGSHPLHLTDVISSTASLREAVKVSWNSQEEVNPRVTVSLPFFNPGERFEVVVLFDGATEDCDVYCRMPDVKCTIDRLSNTIQTIVRIGVQDAMWDVVEQKRKPGTPDYVYKN